MDISLTVSSCVQQIVRSSDKDVGHKMKVLLLDCETVPIISTAVSQSTLLGLGVYLIDRLDNNAREKMRHLRCICLIRPSVESVQLLVNELHEPKYGEYRVCFTNIIGKASLECLAEADDFEVVKAIQEYFVDFTVINSDLFSLNINAPNWRLWADGPDEWNINALKRCADGVVAILLSLKKKPLIRYARCSPLTAKLASVVQNIIFKEEQLFSFRKADTPPILLLLDRRQDPVSPLLAQWTYQAMVHHLIGIENGRVVLGKVSEPGDDLREIMLSQDQDTFFKNNMFLNFGDLGGNIKDYVQQYQSRTENNTNIESISDMKRFIEEYPEFRKLSGNVSKHVTLVSELSRRVTAENWLEVSEVEQSLATNDNHGSDLKAIQRLILSPSVTSEAKVGLVALYALRYQKLTSNASPMLEDLLVRAGNVSPDLAAIVQKITIYSSSLHTAPSQGGFAEIFEPASIFTGATTRLRGLKGIENVYTQHTTPLEEIVQNLIKGRLKEQNYPYTSGRKIVRKKPQDIIIFIIGGVTYEEARMVASVNKNTPSIRVVLGGTTIHSSTTFLSDVDYSVDCWRVVPDK